MSRFVYEGKEYPSKSDLIRELFVNGKLKNEVLSKSHFAKELGITVQTVHATLIKILNSPSSFKPQTSNKNDNNVYILSVGQEPPDGVIGKKIKVNWAPNIWGLPITNPALYVIDPTFKGDVYIKTEDRENSLQELIK